VSQYVELDALNALSPGQPKPYRAGAWDIVVVRVGDDLYALENRCSHDDEGLVGGELEDGAIVCPRHGAKFCLKTGDALCPPAYEPIRRFEVRCQDGRFGVLI
jgi:3-phenylpropionate/trans-cinnamate dioxygenase ferredoxin subunit